MDSDDDPVIRDTGERLAISMTVSAVLSEIAGSDDGKLDGLHALLSEILEAQLAQLPDDGTAASESTRGMFGHATAALDRVFVMAGKFKRLREGGSGQL